MPKIQTNFRSSYKQAFLVFVYFTTLGLLSRLTIGLFSSFELSLIKDLAIFIWAIQFDLAAAGFFTIIWSLLGVFVFRSNILNRLWLGFLGFFYLIIASSDYLYIQESGRHLGYEVQNLLSISGALPDLLQKYFIYILLSAVVSFLVLIILKIKSSYVNSLGQKLVLFVIILLPSFICVRGFRGIPLDPSYAYRAGSVREANISLNPVYSVVYAGLSGKKAERARVAVPEGLDTKKIFKEWVSSRGIKAPKFNHQTNIIIVYLEGWPIIRKTPFFTDFANKQALKAELFLASGHRTVEGMFASLCSFPNPFDRGIMFSQLENFEYLCLPELLKQKGYHTAFFQGSDQLTSGVGPLAQKLGFEVSFGKNEYPVTNQPRNFWGLYDTELYQHVDAHLEQNSEPFLIGINTNTTHDLKLPDGVPWEMGKSTRIEQHASVMLHADQELKIFLERLKKRTFKLPVTIVLVADHTSYVDHGYLDNYAIPLAIHSPLVQVRELKGVATHKDVAATLADLTGVKAPHFLGESLLKRESDGMFSADLYHSGMGLWFEGEWVVLFDTKIANKYTCHQWKADWMLQVAQECPPQAQTMYEKGVSFLHETQDILFSGKTQQWPAEYGL
ncbi:MAG: LTA synthase family protein [Bdellovibrionia bacterium]